MSVLKIGWSEVNITPDKKVALDGQFAERISQYVEKPITITAMAIDSGDDHAVMCSVDLLMMKKQVVKAVRERLANSNLGIDPKKVMVISIRNKPRRLPATRTSRRATMVKNLMLRSAQTTASVKNRQVRVFQSK